MNWLFTLVVVLSLVVYTWTFFNMPIFLVGIVRYCTSQSKHGIKGRRRNLIEKPNLPVITILIPSKNEGSVLPRLLSALLKQDYPKDNMDIIVIEADSDVTKPRICTRDLDGLRIRVLKGKKTAIGKPWALKEASKYSKGDIVAVFDADAIPEPNALRNAAEYFSDASVVAVQGRTMTVNSDANMLTKLISYEEVMLCECFMRGKDTLNLFVYLKGSCQFIRRETLNRLGGWDEKHLSEDLDISARLAYDNAARIRYAPDVRAWQECPETLTQLFIQRTRWFRGTMELALKHGSLVMKPSLKAIDAELTLFGPFVLIMSLLNYILCPLVFEGASDLALAVTLLGWIGFTITIFGVSLALIYAAKPLRLKDVLWLPFLFAYWFLQVFVAAHAFASVLLQRPRVWRRTPKTGNVSSKSCNYRNTVLNP